MVYNINISNKIRIGSKNDGGYVVVKVCDYDLLLSGGISNNVEFEKDFYKLNKTTPIIGFDGTIEKLPKTRVPIKFIKKNIGPDVTPTTTNMKNYIANYQNIFLKLDIEGSEFDFLRCLGTKEMNKFKQIVIEFHHAHCSKECWDILKKINQTHYLVHINGNNNESILILKNHNNIHLPKVFECTYIRKDLYLGDLKLNTYNFPTVLDSPCRPSRPLIKLLSYPYSL